MEERIGIGRGTLGVFDGQGIPKSADVRMDADGDVKVARLSAAS
jgi:hypothetical protein